MAGKTEGQSSLPETGGEPLGGISQEVRDAIGGEIDTGKSVPQGENPLAQAPPTAPAPAHAPAPKEAPADAKGVMIPKTRLDQVIAERNQLRQQAEQNRVQAARNEQAAQTLDGINSDPETARILREHYARQSGALPPRQPVTISPDEFEENPGAAVQQILADQIAEMRAQTDRQIQASMAQVQQQNQQFMGVLSDLVQEKVNRERGQLQKAYPDYDPNTDDPAIQAKMTAHNLSFVDAYTLVRSEKGLPVGEVSAAGENPETPSTNEPNPGEVVLGPTGTPQNEGLAKQTNQLLMRAQQTGRDEDYQAYLEASALQTGEIHRFVRGEQG